MTWDVSSSIADFPEAVEWFRERVPLRKASWEKLTAEAKQRAFTVANVAQLDLIYDVHAALERALANGEDFEQFKTRIGEKLIAAWAGSVAAPARRLESIFRTNVQQAYAAGRYVQATDPVVLEDRPIWMFDAVSDKDTTPVCRESDGTILPAKHPWWRTHLAPLHIKCRSGFITLTIEQAKALGGITKKPTSAEPSGGFGAPPTAPQWEPDRSKYPKDLWDIFQSKKDGE